MTKRPPAQITSGSIGYWAELMTARGHASIFARNSVEDKRVVERATVMEWVDAISVLEDVQVDAVAPGPDNAFPDFTARLNGEPVSIQLTELLHSKNILKLAAKRQPNFEGVQWTEHRFRERIRELLDAKAGKLSRSRRLCDVLIIHSDEPWLTPQKIEEWLAGGRFDKRPEIAAVYLLITYVPGWAEHWPLFRIYGPLE